MSRPLVQRYAGPVAGLFVVSVLILLLVLVLAASSRGNWFARTVPVTVTLPEEGAFGLRPGADIQILGIVAGNVTEITLVGDRLVAQGRIRGDLATLLRVDVPVYLRRTLLVSGDTYLEIVRSEGTPFAEGETMVLRAQTDPSLESLPGELRETLASFTRTARAYEGLLERIEDPEGRVQQILANTESVTREMERVVVAFREQDAIGMIADMRERVDRIIASLDNLVGVATEGVETATATVRTVEEQLTYLPELAEASAETIRLVQGNLTQLREIIESLERVTETLSDELRDSPGVLMQVRSTLKELESLSRALRRSWLVTGPELGREPSDGPDEPVGGVDLIGNR
ncbi:MlaD family protein [Mucisphaera calidilacus]|uniref:Mce/MlaD domain-containing protein n=1 Tax=Mucisphaera calidilacus TaxID=2527982 RepID=A0A518BTQ3_9BACT|nr:MlaD family protein [Mucisphaera calidilacus]QDU70348.1 hypothetical protein Pan265_01740 [Mucisphaera calidilacus]